MPDLLDRSAYNRQFQRIPLGYRNEIVDKLLTISIHQIFSRMLKHSAPK